MTARAVDVVVSGRVQGVFYRASCEQQAVLLGVRGWVTNAADGTVAGHFEGDCDAVEELIDWCHDGPRHAQVSDVEVRDTAAQGLTSFEAR